MAVVSQVAQQIAVTDFEVKGTIGGSAARRMYKCYWKAKDITVTLKEVTEEYEREVQAVCYIKHPNIIELYATTSQTDFIPRFYIVSEFAENGSLHDYFQQLPKQPDLEKSMLWAKDVSKGMEYLHQQRQAHRDLRSYNVLLTSDWTAKVCFFGSTKEMKHTPVLSAHTGWMAPEMLREIAYFHKQDVFFFGILLWELITHDVPYSGLTHMQMLMEVGKENGLRPEIPDSCLPKLKQLIEGCWQDDPAKRPEFTEVLSSLQCHTN